MQTPIISNFLFISQESVEPTPEEHDQINLLISPPPKMSFALVDYKKKKLKELSKR